MSEASEEEQKFTGNRSSLFFPHIQAQPGPNSPIGENRDHVLGVRFTQDRPASQSRGQAQGPSFQLHRVRQRGQAPSASVRQVPSSVPARTPCWAAPWHGLGSLLGIPLVLGTQGRLSIASAGGPSSIRFRGLAAAAHLPGSWAAILALGAARMTPREPPSFPPVSPERKLPLDPGAVHTQAQLGPQHPAGGLCGSAALPCPFPVQLVVVQLPESHSDCPGPAASTPWTGQLSTSLESNVPTCLVGPSLNREPGLGSG